MIGGLRSAPRSRRFILFLVLALVSTVALERVAARYWGWPHDWIMYRLRVPIFSEAWSERVAALVRQEQSAGSAREVWIGDSLVEALPCDRLRPPCLNLGIGGDTAFGVLHRIGRHRSLASASRVHLLMGHNDLGRTRDTAYIASLYRRALAAIPPGPRVVCHGILPVDERATDQRNNADIAALNRRIRATCQRVSRARYIDLTEIFMDSTRNLRSELHRGDGVHLSHAGLQLWISALSGELSTPPT